MTNGWSIGNSFWQLETAVRTDDRQYPLKPGKAQLNTLIPGSST